MAKTVSRDEIRLSLGNKLKELRKSAGLSQRDVANKLGLGSSQFISNIERGTCLPPENVVLEMSKLYKVPLKYLVQCILSVELDIIANDYRKKYPKAYL